MKGAFRRRIRQAIADPVLQGALDRNAERRQAAVRQAFTSVADPGALRRQARQIRLRSLAQLDSLIETFTGALQANGVHVHAAVDSADACRLVTAIARSHGAGTVIKAKSMVSEEIGLNHALESEGIRPLETDLGEYLVQLRGEAPSHIISPVVHLRREDAGATLEEALAIPYTTDVETMTRAVRRALRREFLGAAVGLSGVNFGVAETGTLCVVTNEGNGRMVTSVPPVHIALMGVERLVATLDELAVMLAVLPRSATGQKMSSYVSLIHGPRRGGDADGPRERHVILVDNGRHRLRRTPLSEALLCIRCGACLNACPVYQEIGGHAYGSIYPGPIGAVLSPGLFGLRDHGELAYASTLCGACTDICPVQIEFPTLLLRVRDQLAREAPARGLRGVLRLYAWLMSGPRRYRWAERAAASGTRLLPRKDGWATRLPPPFSAWTRRGDFPPFAAVPFHRRWRRLGQQGEAVPLGTKVTEALVSAGPPASVEQVEQFHRELLEVGGELVRCCQEDLSERLAAIVREAKADRLLAWNLEDAGFPGLRRRLENEGLEIVSGEAEGQGESPQPWRAWADIEVGLTGAAAGFAETGTIVLPAGPGRLQTASLLPWVHLAILRQSDLHASLDAWLAAGGGRLVRQAQAVALVSGPSRTADIEMMLTIGVHGPGRLVVFLVEEDSRSEADGGGAVRPLWRENG
jgi:L-lactate dehydrogenase complex protein LldF